MQWLRPMIKLIRVRQRLWNSMFLGSYHDRALFTLSRHPIKWVNLEFKDRDLREYPILPPADFDKFCAGSSDTIHTFTDNTVFSPPARDSFVWIFFNKSTGFNDSSGEAASRARGHPAPIAHIGDTGPQCSCHLSMSIPSPFLTDQQWYMLETSFHQVLERIYPPRKNRRSLNAVSYRLLLESMFLKLAFDIRWKSLPALVKHIHPEVRKFPLSTCRVLYRDLYYSGFLQSVYKHLYSHFSLYGGTSLEKLVKQGCFQIDNKSISLAPGVPLSWQNFTALLLLQRAYHNYRAKNRETSESQVTPCPSLNDFLSVKTGLSAPVHRNPHASRSASHSPNRQSQIANRKSPIPHSPFPIFRFSFVLLCVLRV